MNSNGSIDINSIYNILKDELVKQKAMELAQISTNNKDEYKKQNDEIERMYSFYSEKLEFIKKINEYDNETKVRFISIIKKISLLKNESDMQKLLMVISYGVLVDYFRKIHERTDEEILMLSSCSIELDLEDYTYYIGILSNSDVSKSIIEKTDNLRKQEKIAYNIMDSQDTFDYDFITSENYDKLVNNALNVIKSYVVKDSKLKTDITNEEEIICKDCGKKFSFPTNITATDLFNNGMNLMDAQSLLNARNHFKNLVLSKEDVTTRIQAMNNYLGVERTIIDYSDGNSREAYEFRGYKNLPLRCPECRKKMREKMEHQDKNNGPMHK